MFIYSRCSQITLCFLVKYLLNKDMNSKSRYMAKHIDFVLRNLSERGVLLILVKVLTELVINDFSCSMDFDRRSILR